MRIHYGLPVVFLLVIAVLAVTSADVRSCTRCITSYGPLAVKWSRVRHAPRAIFDNRLDVRRTFPSCCLFRLSASLFAVGPVLVACRYLGSSRLCCCCMLLSQL